MDASSTVAVHQSDYNSSDILKDGQSINSGKKSDGWLNVFDGDKGVSVWMRDLWQQYPLQLEYSAGTMNVYFWPGQGLIRHGQR